MRFELEGETSKILLSRYNKRGLVFCGEHKLQNRHSVFLVTSPTPPAHSQFPLISPFLSELSKIKVLLVVWSVVFGHFHNHRIFWGREERVGEVVYNSLHLSSPHFQHYSGWILFKRFMHEIV